MASSATADVGTADDFITHPAKQELMTSSNSSPLAIGPAIQVHQV